MASVSIPASEILPWVPGLLISGWTETNPSLHKLLLVLVFIAAIESNSKLVFSAPQFCQNPVTQQADSAFPSEKQQPHQVSPRNAFLSSQVTLKSHPHMDIKRELKWKPPDILSNHQFSSLYMAHKCHLSFLFLAAKQLSHEKQQGLLGSLSAMHYLLFHNPTQSA